MKHQMKFTLRNLRNWDSIVFEKANRFHSKFRVYPNILQASSLTFHQIDMIANFLGRDKLQNEQGIKSYPITENGSLVSLGCFCSEEFEIDFAVDDNLQLNKFQLIFDDNPKWGDVERHEDLPIGELVCI